MIKIYKPFSKISIRLLIGGWVEKRPPNENKLLLFSGLFSIKDCFISSLLVSRLLLPEIFLSAEAKASAFFVSSTAPASAKYSLFLESANLKRIYKK